MTTAPTERATAGSFRIRPFAVSDTEEVVALWRAAGLVKPWNDPYLDIERKLTVQPELFLVAEAAASGPGSAGSGAGSTVVGSVMAGYDGHRGWVNYLAVADPERGTGLGRALMAEVERLLLERGCPKLNLQVRSANTAVIAFYERLGYRLDDAVSLGKRLIPDGPDASSASGGAADASAAPGSAAARG
ncbi:GNAT family acetyltransferase [Agromyces mediolanus]|uniref:GNAT family acetyltransferase n=1 Tax=Agromyces mediolanus TaxID=41986 RepID=UPI00203D78BE|nr:GNAT family acetyltransferase [Agromyces mediolanus]MCM3656328.1 GNAT family acetyltransferase [Agromyces mediolanus]